MGPTQHVMKRYDFPTSFPISSLYSRVGATPASADKSLACLGIDLCHLFLFALTIIRCGPTSLRTVMPHAVVARRSTQALRDAQQGQRSAKLKGQKLEKSAQKLKNDLAKSRAVSDRLQKEVRGQKEARNMHLSYGQTEIETTAVAPARRPVVLGSGHLALHVLFCLLA